ncbi:MAG: arsenate reductase ArsC [Pseudomonadota bacterium]
MTNVLFLCTGNSARSIMAESYLNAAAQGVTAYSAGSSPTGTPNPFAIQTLEAAGVGVHTGDGGAPASKSWDVFAAPGAPFIDVVITVCDNAAGEVCPVWPTKPGGLAPQTRHWSFPDPAAVGGSDADKLAAFNRVFGDIRQQIDGFVSELSA